MDGRPLSSDASRGALIHCLTAGQKGNTSAVVAVGSEGGGGGGGGDGGGKWRLAVGDVE